MVIDRMPVVMVGLALVELALVQDAKPRWAPSAASIKSAPGRRCRKCWRSRPKASGASPGLHEARRLAASVPGRTARRGAPVVPSVARGTGDAEVAVLQLIAGTALWLTAGSGRGDCGALLERPSTWSTT